MLYKQKWPNIKELSIYVWEGNGNTKANQAKFFWKNTKVIELTVPFPEMLNASFPNRHLHLLSRPSRLKLRAKVHWAVPPKTEIRNHLLKVKKVSWEPETDLLSSVAQEAWWSHLHLDKESLNTSSGFKQTSGCFMEVKRSSWLPKRGKPSKLHFRPTTTIWLLLTVPCSPHAHTHKNSSQY